MGLDPVLAWSASFVGSRPSCLFWGSITPEPAGLTDMGRGGGVLRHHPPPSGTCEDTGRQNASLPIPAQPQHSSSVAGIFLD